MTSPILPGAEPWSHTGDSTHGAVVLHGFTGSPWEVRSKEYVASNGHLHSKLLRYFK